MLWKKKTLLVQDSWVGKALYLCHHSSVPVLMKSDCCLMKGHRVFSSRCPYCKVSLTCCCCKTEFHISWEKSQTRNSHLSTESLVTCIYKAITLNFLRFVLSVSPPLSLAPKKLHYCSVTEDKQCSSFF